MDPSAVSMVECARCRQWIPMGETDIVEGGYRCDACGLAVAEAALAAPPSPSPSPRWARESDPPLVSRRGIIGQLEREATELVEPTPSAPVPAAPEVTCVRCGAKVPLAQTDLCGLGYRCRACSLRAEVGELEGTADVGDHLIAADRARFAEQGKRLAIKAAGVAALMLVGGVTMIAIAPRASGAWLKLMMGGLLVALGIGGRGLDRYRRFRR